MSTKMHRAALPWNELRAEVAKATLDVVDADTDGVTLRITTAAPSDGVFRQQVFANLMKNGGIVRIAGPNGPEDVIRLL